MSATFLLLILLGIGRSITGTQLASHGPVRELGLSIGSQGAGAIKTTAVSCHGWRGSSLLATQVGATLPSGGRLSAPRLWGAVGQARQQHRPD